MPRGISTPAIIICVLLLLAPFILLLALSFALPRLIKAPEAEPPSESQCLVYWQNFSSALGSSSVPPPRWDAGFSSISSNSLMLFGGTGASGILGDFWLFNTSSPSWDQISFPVAPSARKDHAMFSIDHEVWIFGGENATGVLNDLWVYDSFRESDQWQMVIPVSGAIVTGRSGHCAVPTRQKRGFYVYGGAPFSSTENQVLFFDADFYQWVIYTSQSVSPPGRKWHSCVVLADDTLVISFGNDGAGPRSDVWAWKDNIWTEVQPAAGSPIPPPRSNQVAWPSLKLDGFSIFGGEAAGSYGLSDFWQYSFSTARWQPVTYGSGNQTMPLPAARLGHSATIASPGVMYVFGGVSGQLQPVYRNDVWRRELVGDCDFESSPVTVPIPGLPTASPSSQPTVAPPPSSNVVVLPSAKKLPSNFTLQNGTTVSDNYAYMSDKTRAETRAYFAAEVAYEKSASTVFNSAHSVLFNELSARVITDLQVQFSVGRYAYYWKPAPGTTILRQWFRVPRLIPGAPEQMVLDERQIANGKTFFSLNAFAPSFDGHYLAIVVDTVGNGTFTVFFKDLLEMVILPDDIRGVAGGGVAWANNDTVFYTKSLPYSPAQPSSVFRHTVGLDVLTDVMVYDEFDQSFVVDLRNTNCGEYVVITSSSLNTTEVRYLSVMTPQADFQLLVQRVYGVRYYFEHRTTHFYLLSNNNSNENFFLERIPLSADRTSVLWDQREELISSSSVTLLARMQLHSNFIAVFALTNSVDTVYVVPLIDGSVPIKETVPLLTIPHTSRFSIRRLAEAYPEVRFGNYDDTKLQFVTASLISPPSLYSYNPSNKSVSLQRQMTIAGYDPAGYRDFTRNVFSRDNVPIPLTTAFRRDVDRGKSNPMLLFAADQYGDYFGPWFEPLFVSLLTRGVMIARTDIRGCAIQGTTWWTSGRGTNKYNALNDFIDVAAKVSSDGTSSPHHLALYGRRAGGALVAAVLAARPDVASVAWLQDPFADILTSLRTTSAPLSQWSQFEWGNPALATEEAVIAKYDPYLNLNRRSTLPNIMLQTGNNDMLVPYWGPLKFAAKLREYRKDTKGMTIVHYSDAGRRGTPDALYYSDWAFQLAFVLTFVAPAGTVMSTPSALIGISIALAVLACCLVCLFIAAAMFIQREERNDASLQLKQQRNQEEMRDANRSQFLMEINPSQSPSVSVNGRASRMFDSDVMVARPPSQTPQPYTAEHSVMPGGESVPPRESAFGGSMFVRPPAVGDSRSMVDPKEHHRNSTLLMKQPLVEPDPRGQSEPPKPAEVNRQHSVTHIISSMLAPGGEFAIPFFGTRQSGTGQPEGGAADTRRVSLLSDVSQEPKPAVPNIYDQPVSEPLGAHTIYDQPVSVPATAHSIYDQPATVPPNEPSVYDQVASEAVPAPVDEEPHEGRPPSFTELVARLTSEPPPPESIFDMPVAPTQTPAPATGALIPPPGMRASSIPTDAPPAPPAEGDNRQREPTQVGRESSLTRVLHDLLSGTSEEKKPQS